MALDEAQIEALEASLNDGVSQLLLETSRMIRREAVRRLEERSGFRGFRATHAALLHHIKPEGTRSGDIAATLGISKQAVSQLVSELEAMRVIERAPDPTDGRAKLIRFTEGGRVGALEGLVVMAELEREISTALGAQEEVTSLRDALALVRDGLRQVPPPK